LKKEHQGTVICCHCNKTIKFTHRSISEESGYLWVGVDSEGVYGSEIVGAFQIKDKKLILNGIIYFTKDNFFFFCEECCMSEEQSFEELYVTENKDFRITDEYTQQEAKYKLCPYALSASAEIANLFCRGCECMAWRWSTNKDSLLKGHCGLAGKPGRS